MTSAEEGDAAEAKLAQESLHCYAMLVGIDESTLGFGISLGFNGETLVNARSPFEFVSYEAFIGVEIEENGGANTRRSASTWLCAMCTASNQNGVLHCRGCRAAPPRTDIQLMSEPAAEMLGVRQNSCGTERFTHFLPLYLSKEHFRPELCARCLQAAFCRVPTQRLAACETSFVDESVWNVLPALMNSTAVAMMGGELHTSDVALRGYYNLHRLLLAMSSPALRARAEVESTSFAQDPARRLKIACPNLGHLLPRLLLVSSPLQAWHDIQEALLSEAIDRTVLHAYREFPALGQEQDAEYARLRWQSAAKGFRMLLFSVRFLRHAAQWGSSDQVASHYDKYYGQPGSGDRDSFRQQVRQIMAVDSWQEFSECWSAESSEPFEPRSVVFRLGGSQSALVQLLRESENSSAQKSYHGGPGPEFLVSPAQSGRCKGLSFWATLSLVGALAAAFLAVGVGLLRR
ncbi:unnamed protein product [Polarella glacialis]|uniref:RanBP2-type domain-containing protein n=1 Tax=Polarella glacialis TaxID=89957 RepID=A0A813IN71_POLGL|nr:unnamed protein product [Polarella glacialis]